MWTDHGFLNCCIIFKFVWARLFIFGLVFVSRDWSFHKCQLRRVGCQSPYGANFYILDACNAWPVQLVWAWLNNSSCLLWECACWLKGGSEWRWIWGSHKELWLEESDVKNWLQRGEKHCINALSELWENSISIWYIYVWCNNIIRGTNLYDSI